MHSVPPQADLLLAAQTLPPDDIRESTLPVTAGLLLRHAREAVPMHVEALAGVLKVPVKKIEALERDDWDAMPDLAFTRALANSVCRYLKIDAEPVLALLPSAPQRAPEAPAVLAEDKALAASRLKLSLAATGERSKFGRWFLALVMVLLIAAALAGLAFAAGLQPSTWSQKWPFLARETQAETGAASAEVGELQGRALTHEDLAQETAPQTNAALAAASPATSAATATHIAASPAPALTSTATGVQIADRADVLSLHATADCWVQVRDAKKSLQLSRLLRAGERAQIQSAAPYQLWIGKAEALQISWNAQPVEALQGKMGTQRLTLPPPVPAMPATAATPAQRP